MDDLLSEFLTETAESLDVVDVELVKFEQEPTNSGILDNIFRLVHTIKGTCGFLGLPRLEALAHSAETLMGKYRDGATPTSEGVSLILETIDRLKEILEQLEQEGAEPDGADQDLIEQLDAMSAIAMNAMNGEGGETPAEAPAPVSHELERELKPGEVSLDELEAAFQNAPGPDDMGAESASLDEAPAVSVEAEAPVQAETPTPAEPPAPAAKVPAAPAAKPAAAQKEDAKPKEGAAVKAQTIRVNVETLEQLMTMVSELVLTRNQLLEMVRRLDDSEFKVPLQRLSNVTAELQEGVMKTRMQPIGNAWQKLPRIIRDLSKELDKKINLEMIGAETELDRQVLEQIKDPLTHMVRNSADHGLETTEGRLAAGKSEVGNVTLSAYHEGGHIIIKIADDGQGLPTDKIKSKVIANGIATEAELEEMSENQIHKLIFHAGLSTAEKVTNVSGRGVGMDVVRTNIELIGGTVDLTSVAGEGTTFIIKIPLTLAIVSALIVEASGQRFAIPQLAVLELVKSNANAEHRIEMINDSPVLRLRNKLLPVISMSKLLGHSSGIKTEEGEGEENNGVDQNVFVVVVQVGGQTFGIVVDAVFHTEEIVVKPMSSMLREITMFSGNTILGDGSVILIVDPNGIAQAVARDHGGAQESNHVDAADAADLIGNEEKTALLVFKSGSDDLKAVPLSLVTRLEEVDVANIEKSNNRDLVQYRGKLMPLIYIEDHLTHKDEGLQPILVFADESHSMGLVVDEIVDIVEDRLTIEISSEKDGIVGSAVIKGKATEVIDVGYYLPKAFDDWLEKRDIPNPVQRELKLLLVDDSAFFRNLLSPLLASAGYRVTMVESATDALQLKENGEVFDVIVSDIEMPEMDGITFASTLKDDSQWGQTPIIALSSHTNPEVIARGRAAGFRDYVAKFDREGLIESIRECKPVSENEAAA
ncbi:MAG: hybrid sensor histidine kinase/response regulator [Rhizobiales bacterium]|nr:hybrid sensor histidine kinase/response regulator [Hyphomicrobiales bacterium]